MGGAGLATYWHIICACHFRAAIPCTAAEFVIDRAGLLKTMHSRKMGRRTKYITFSILVPILKLEADLSSLLPEASER